MKLKTLFGNITQNSSREESGKWKMKLGGKLTFQYQVRVEMFFWCKQNLKRKTSWMKGQSWIQLHSPMQMFWIM